MRARRWNCSWAEGGIKYWAPDSWQDRLWVGRIGAPATHFFVSCRCAVVNGRVESVVVYASELNKFAKEIAREA